MLLTPPEAAERLRVSLRMVYALRADGSITAVRIRRAKRIDEAICAPLPGSAGVGAGVDF